MNKRLEKEIKYCLKYTDVNAALRCVRVNRENGQIRRIVLGDDNKHWIVTNAVAFQLVKLGYEML